MTFQLENKAPHASKKNIFWLAILFIIWFILLYYSPLETNWYQRIVEIFIILFAYRIIYNYWNTIQIIKFEENSIQFSRFKDKGEYTETHSKQAINFVDTTKGYLIISKNSGKRIYGKRNHSLYKKDWKQDYKLIKTTLVNDAQITQKKRIHTHKLLLEGFDLLPPSKK